VLSSLLRACTWNENRQGPFQLLHIHQTSQLATPRATAVVYRINERHILNNNHVLPYSVPRILHATSNTLLHSLHTVPRALPLTPH